MIFTETQNMTFTETLITNGYKINTGDVFDDEFIGFYVKHDDDECVFHCYKQHDEIEGVWNYVKMTDGLLDVIVDVPFNPDWGWEVK